MSKKITSLFNFKKLQKFSSALMLPIAILPAAGLILAIGISFNIELLANCGGLIFANLPLLFCVGIVIGLTGDGSSSLSAIISYMIMNATMGTQLGITAESVAASNGDYAMILGVPTLQTGVFGGLILHDQIRATGDGRYSGVLCPIARRCSVDGGAVYDRSFPDHDVCVTCRRVGDVSGSKTGT